MNYSSRRANLNILGLFIEDLGYVSLFSLVRFNFYGVGVKSYMESPLPKGLLVKDVIEFRSLRILGQDVHTKERFEKEDYFLPKEVITMVKKNKSSSDWLVDQEHYLKENPSWN